MIKHHESEIAERLGIPLAEVRQIRFLVLAKPEHWDVERKKVVYTIDGIEFLEKYIQWQFSQGIRQRSALLDIGMKVPEPVEQLTVFKFCPNPRILIAKRATGELVRVRVRSCHNFIVNMKLPAQRVQKDLYEFSGRLPRWKGKY